MGQALLVEGYIPADCNVLPGLCFLQAFVIVCFKLDERSKYILIDVGIIIPATSRNGLIRSGVTETTAFHSTVQTFFAVQCGLNLFLT